MRICLCIAEDDLRTWVMEELLLMTWVEQPTIVTASELSAVDVGAMSVLLVGADQLPPRDLERLQARTWAVPIVAIGSDRRIPGAHVLSSKLTSRELKLAIRATLLTVASRTESAAG